MAWSRLGPAWLVVLVACGSGDDVASTAADGGTDAPADATTSDARGPDASDAAASETGATDASDAGALDAALDANDVDGAAPPDAGPITCPTTATSRTAGTQPAALPSITWSGAGYAVVLDQSAAPGTYQLAAEKTDGTGARVGAVVPLTQADGASRLWPRVAFSGYEHGISFLDETTAGSSTTRRAAFMRADAQLNPIAGSTVLLGDPDTSAVAAVAWGHGTWAVAWSGRAPDGGAAQTVRLQRLDPTGALVGAPLVVGPGAVSDNGTPFIATSGGWALVATGSPATLYEIDLQGTVRAVALPFDALRASIATDGAEYALVAGDNPAHFARAAIGGSVVAASVTTLGTSGQLPNVGWNGASYVVTWSESTAGLPRPLLFATLAPDASPNGAPVTGTPFTAQSNAGFHMLAIAPCGWGVVYGTFSSESAYLDVHP